MGRMSHCAGLAALILGLSVCAGLAQEKPAQQKPTTQKPATQKPEDTRITAPTAPVSPLKTKTGKKEQGKQGAEEEQSSSGQGQPSLTGAEQFTLSRMGRGHSYFIPIFQVAVGGDTNALNEFGSTTFESVTTLSGAFSLNHLWSRNHFMANYTGSGFLYNRDLSLSTSAHAFSLSQTISGKRSSFLVADAVSYLPESSFGYSRFGGLGGFNGGYGGLFGVNASNLNGIYIPNQSILTGDSSRVSNALVGEYDYSLSPRSSFTVTGSYALLRFLDSDFIDSNAGLFGAGYSYAVSPRDSVGLSYLGTVFRYDQSEYDFTNHAVAFIYGHQISQLLALRLGAGPQFNVFNNSPGGNTNVSVYGTASLEYQRPRTAFTISYIHYTSAGAGVYQGAETDDVRLVIGRQLTRMWSGSIGAGYSHNKNLSQTSGLTFNTWYATANLQRPLGRHMGVFLSYNLQQQSSNDPFCIGSGCGTFFTRNYFSIGFNWHPTSVELGQD